MRGLGLLSYHDERIRALALHWCAEVLDLVEGGLVQVQMCPQSGHVSRLLANDLGGRVLNDADTRHSWLRLRSFEILRCLIDAPPARVARPSPATSLDDFRR